MTPYDLRRWTDTTRNEIYSFIDLLMARNSCNSVKDYWSKDTLHSSLTSSLLPSPAPLHWRLLGVLSLAQCNLYLTPSWLAPSFRLPFLPPYIITLIPRIITLALKMETVCFPETLASINESTWRLNPEEHHHYSVPVWGLLWRFSECCILWKKKEQIEGDWLRKVHYVFNRFVIVFQYSFIPFWNLCSWKFSALQRKAKLQTRSRQKKTGLKQKFTPLWIRLQIYTDNWYTTPALSIFILKLKTNSCGTVQGNRKGMPPLSQTFI
jgi:hypothetical protein